MPTEPSRRFRTLVDQFELPVFVFDESGTIEYASPELLELAPPEVDEPDQLVDEPVTEYVPEEDVPEVEAALDDETDDPSRVRFALWDERSPEFELVGVNGEVLAGPPSDSLLVGTGPDEPVPVVRALERLHEATNRLYAAGSTPEGLDIVIEAAVEVLGFDWCLLAEASDGAFAVRATSERSPVEAGETPLSTSEGEAGEAYRSGEPRVTDDATRSEVAEPTHPFIRSMLTVPVGSWGVFQAHSRTPGAFGERDLQLAETLVTPLATTIERIEREAALCESHETQERQRRQIEALHAVATRMKSATSRQEVYEMAIEAVEDILAFDICIVDEAEGDVLVPRAVGSNLSIEDYYEETPVDKQANLGSLTYREGETFVVDDLHEAGFAPARSRFSSAISLPLDDRSILQVVSEEGAAFDRTDRRLAELLAEHAAAALDRIDRECELERRARELEERNARLDEFASIVSHDLRNPLNVASLRTEHALRTGDVDSLEGVADALDRMETIVDNVLTLARQGESVDDPRPVDLEHVARRSWEQVPAEDASLSVAGDMLLEADGSRLEHLFENLFRNAIEHSTGAVAVEVGVLPDEDGFYVADDGPGIDEADREHVFERGYTGADGNTGLGLAIVSEVVEAHGWEVRVTEAATGGARFEVSGVDAGA